MKRTFSIHARVSEEEFQAFNLLATRESVSTSEALRLMLRREFDRRGLAIGMAKFNNKIPALGEVKNANQP
jgi:hypothetical protein